MATEFKVGDRVRHEYAEGNDATIMSLIEARGEPAAMARFDRKWEGSVFVYCRYLTLISRASESQREGGSLEKRPCKWGYHYFDGTGGCVECGWSRNDIEDMGPHENDRRHKLPADPAPSQQDSSIRSKATQEGPGVCTSDAPADGVVPSRGDSGRSPQPAPMTRAARVLAKMEEDPYQAGPPWDTPHPGEVQQRNEAARLRMAKWSLDRPLDAEQARWERLVCSKVPVGRR